MSALLELADQEFLSLKHETTTLVGNIEEKLSRGNRDVSVDLLSVEEFLRSSSDVKFLANQAKEAGFALQPLHTETSSEYSNTGSNSALVDIAKQLDFETIDDLSRNISKALQRSKAFFSEQLNENKNEEEDSTEWTISPAFACILILIGLNSRRITIKYLKSRGWDERIARQVLSVSKDFKF